MSRKTYFHPVLTPEGKDYVDDSEFSVSLSSSIRSTSQGDEVIIACEWFLNNKKIKELIKSEEAKVILTAYCPDTMKRFTWELGENRIELKLPLGSVIGLLSLQVAVVASRAIGFFVPSGSNTEFGKSEFSLKEGAPLAISAEKNLYVMTKQKKLLKMIRVQKSESLHRDVYEFIFSSNAITILMGAQIFKYWNLLSLDAAQKPHLFPSIYKDALVEALRTAVEDENIREYPWVQQLLKLVDDRSLLEMDHADFQKINQLVCKLLASKGVERILQRATED